MGINLMDIGLMIKDKDLEYLLKNVDPNIKESGNKEKEMVRVKIYIKMTNNLHIMDLFTMEIGLMINLKLMEFGIFQKEMYIKDFGKLISNMEKENIPKNMDKFTKVIGLNIDNMVRQNRLIIKAINIKDLMFMD